MIGREENIVEGLDEKASRQDSDPTQFVTEKPKEGPVETSNDETREIVG